MSAAIPTSCFTTVAGPEAMHSRLKRMIQAPAFGRLVIFLIVLNAVVLGLETYPQVMAEHGTLLAALDRAILWVFVVELALRAFAYRWDFLRDPWSLFDAVIVAVSFVPANEAFAVLRAARILRVLRLMSAFPQLRTVIEGLVRAIPGISSIGAILCILFYVFAVMATKLYGTHYPDWFGSLSSSMFSLFQIMTLEGWADMVREIMATHPYAWVFFVVYILTSTFTVLNLFIAIIVDAMQRQHDATSPDGGPDTLSRIEAELIRLRKKIDGLTPSRVRIAARRAERSGTHLFAEHKHQ